MWWRFEKWSKISGMREVPFSQILAQMWKSDFLDQNDPFGMHFQVPNHNFTKWSWAEASHFGSLFGCLSIAHQPEVWAWKEKPLTLTATYLKHIMHKSKSTYHWSGFVASECFLKFWVVLGRFLLTTQIAAISSTNLKPVWNAYLDCRYCKSKKL